MSYLESLFEEGLEIGVVGLYHGDASGHGLSACAMDLVAGAPGQNPHPGLDIDGVVEDLGRFPGEVLVVASDPSIKGSFKAALETACEALASGRAATVLLFQAPYAVALRVRGEPAYALIGAPEKNEDETGYLIVSQDAEQPPVSGDCGLRVVEPGRGLADLFEAILAIHMKLMFASRVPFDDVFPGDGAFVVETARPWIHPVYQNPDLPRIARLVTNELSLCLREDTGEQPSRVCLPWPSEVFLLGAGSREELLENLELTGVLVELGLSADLPALACALNCLYLPGDCSYRLAIVAEGRDDLLNKIASCRERLETGESSFCDPQRGLYMTGSGTAIEGRMAFMLPGLGSAYTGMMGDLCMHLPEIREVFDFVDRVCRSVGAEEAPSRRIFPAEAGARGDAASLASAEYAVVAVLMAEHAIYNLLNHLGITPDALLGFSTGEFGVYTMNGCIDVVEAAPLFYRLSTEAARSIPRSIADDLKTMSVFASREQVMSLVERLELPVYLTADLAPEQTIVTGSAAAIEALAAGLSEAGMTSHVLSVSIPYHTSAVDGVIEDGIADKVLRSLNFSACLTESWLCSLARLAPVEPQPILAALTGLLQRPILYRQTVERMYESGVRFFIEVGPQGVLSSQVKQILGECKVVAASSNLYRRHGITQINHLIAELFSHGRSMNLEYLYANRGVLPLENLAGEHVHQDHSDSCCQPDLSGEEVLGDFMRNVTDLNQDMIDSELEILSAYFASVAEQEAEAQLVYLEGRRSYLLEHSGTAGMVLTFIDESRVLEPDSGVLTEAELQELSQRFRDSGRRKQWIMGRLAAKDAVRVALDDAELAYDQIEINAGEDGVPRVALRNRPGVEPPLISIAHAGAAACALAVPPTGRGRPGIDMENLRQMDQGMSELVLSSAEAELVEASAARDLDFLRLWTAKEAAFKAVGGTGVRQFESTGAIGSDRIRLAYAGDKVLEAISLKTGDYLIALVLPQ